jgi:aldehyde dehydrogenase (NAD+)
MRKRKYPLIAKTNNLDLTFLLRENRTEFSIHQNSGQHCQANSRVFVEEGILDQYLEKVVAIMTSRRLGNPLEKDTWQGPQGDETQQKRVLSMIENGKKNGELVLGGKAADVGGKV